MNRFFLFAFAATFVFSLTSCKNMENGKGRPNIILIMSDDCTFNDLPVYGGENVQTPNIDRLAAQGMTFNNAYLSMSMCVPCRAELYTGMYPARNGVCWNHTPARSEMQKASYNI